MVEDSQNISIVIIDSHPITCLGLSTLIARDERMQVVGQAHSYRHGMEAIEKQQPDLAIISISLPDINGLELVKDIRSTWPKVLVLVVSMYDESIFGPRSMNAGANGYIMKQEGLDKILEAMNRVIIGGVYASDALRQQMLNSGLHNSSNSPIDNLSNREITVFDLIGKGLSTNDIATTLEISAKTVSAHREHIKSKLHIEKNDQLIQQATRWVLELNNNI